MNQPRPKHWKAETPSLGARVLAALTRSSFAVPLALAIVLAVKVISIVSAPTGRQQDFFSTPFLVNSGLFVLVTWGLLFGMFLVRTSRSWSDRLFTTSGFLATFFGLAILAIFFIQLADEVVQWYHYTPLLVEAQNEKNEQELAILDDAKKSEDLLRRQLARSEKERDDALQQSMTEEARKELLDLYAQAIEQQRRDIEKTQAENKIIAERSLRPDASGSGVTRYFLTNGPSDQPQDAGIGPALWGSILLGLITVAFAVPVGVGAALYLEEYRTNGWLAKLIQVNINNLAGVPSVVYGILGGFVFVYIFRLLQTAHPGIADRNLLGGGLTLGLLTLPMIIVSAQEAIRAVPTSLQQGAYALGATKWQVMWTIVLPMARPGILTGTILSLSRAVGEAAPLVLFGAQLFVDENPSFFTRFTALPLQIFNWCDRPAMLVGDVPVDIWKFNAAVASSVLLIVILSMNAVAIVLRNRAQQKMRY